jgi:hypothetical protein
VEKEAEDNQMVIFTFTIEGELEVDEDPCPHIPAPRDCTFYEAYGYIKEMIGGPGSEYVIVDVLVDGETIFPEMYSPEPITIPYNENAAYSDKPLASYLKIYKDQVVSIAVLQIGETSPGSDLTVEVRCK